MNLRKDRTSEICQKFAVVGFGGIVFVFLIGKEYFTYLMMTKTKIKNSRLHEPRFSKMPTLSSCMTPYFAKSQQLRCLL